MQLVNESPAGDDGAVYGDLVISLEDDGGGYGGEMAAKVRRGESGLGVGVHGYVLAHLKSGVIMMKFDFILHYGIFSIFLPF